MEQPSDDDVSSIQSDEEATLVIKRARQVTRADRSEDGGGGENSKEDESIRDISLLGCTLELELKEANETSHKLVDEIRAMKIAIADYQLRDDTCRKEDKLWLERRESEVMKKLGEFEEITRKVLHFMGLADIKSTQSSVILKFPGRVVTEYRVPSEAKMTEDGRGHEDQRSSSLSLVQQELREADSKACKTANQIHAIKNAIAEYHQQKDPTQDTNWLEIKETELIQKLEEFEEITRRVKRLVGLPDVCSTADLLSASQVSEKVPRHTSGVKLFLEVLFFSLHLLYYP